jgi:hypothetical protein
MLLTVPAEVAWVVADHLAMLLIMPTNAGSPMIGIP